MYEGWLFLHVLAIVVWVGGAIALQLQALRAERADEPGRIAAIAHESEWIGLRVFMPASLVALASGILMVAREPGWTFGEPWILFGLAALAVSFLVGALFLGPETGRIGELADRHGPDHPDVRRRIRRVFLVSRAELLLLVLVIAAMATKPGA